MYPSNSTYDPKFMATPPSAPPMAQAPPSYGAPASGIPFSFTAQHQLFQPPPPKANGPWSTGLCDCFDDVPNCCITCWCPCITFGEIAEIVDKGSTSCGASGGIYTLLAFVTGCPFIYSCFYRSKLRQQYGLHESPCADCLVHCCCESCALCQEYRELKNHGFDMSIGWHGNMEKQHRVAAMAMAMVPPPVVDEGMRR